MKNRPFVEFLQQKLDRRGDATRFAAAIGVSTSTVTAWMKGRMTPNFSNCLPISRYFDIKIDEVFQLIGRPDFLERFIDGSSIFQISEHSDTVIAVDPEHLKVHKQLEKILGRAKALKRELAQTGRQPTKAEAKTIRHAEWISGNIEVFEERGSGKFSLPDTPPTSPTQSSELASESDPKLPTKKDPDHQAQWIYERRSGIDRRAAATERMEDRN